MIFTTLLLHVAQPDPNVLDRWVQVLNTRDKAKIEAFHRNLKWTDDPYEAMRSDLFIVRRGGTLTIIKKPSAHEAIVRMNAVDEYSTFSITKDEKGGLSLSILPSDLNTVPGFPQATAKTLVPIIQKRLNLAKRSGRFDGTFMLLKDGKPLIKWANGLADRVFIRHNRLDTPFSIASLTKMYTMAIIGQLMDEGKLTFDTKVGELLPNYPHATVREKVTIRHLLSHKSGIPNFMTEAYLNAPEESIRSLEDQTKYFANEPLDFEPGSMQMYTNSGFIILGMIMEKLDQKPFQKIFQDRLFRPLKMTSSTALFHPEAALNYTFDPVLGPPELDKLMTMHPNPVLPSGPYGGTLCSAPDIAKFFEALRKGKVIKHSTFEAMKAPSGQMTNVGGRAYAHGIELRILGDLIAWGHSGGHPGSNAYAFHLEKGGYTVIALANIEEQASRVARYAMFHAAQVARKEGLPRKTVRKETSR